MQTDRPIQDDDPAQDRLLADLARLAQVIDARRFPGRAWPVRRRTVLRVWWPPALAATAAAAAILLAVVLAWKSDRPVPAQFRTAPLAQVEEQAEDWDVPADITPELADMAQPNLVGQLDLSIPTVSMPPLGGGTFTWNVPQMDLTPRIDIEPDVPADNSQT